MEGTSVVSHMYSQFLQGMVPAQEQTSPAPSVLYVKINSVKWWQHNRKFQAHKN